jgi:hypothetical protein
MKPLHSHQKPCSAPEALRITAIPQNLANHIPTDVYGTDE